MNKKIIYQNLPWEDIYLERNINKITIIDLCEKYKCSKSQFYRYYKEYVIKNNLTDDLNQQQEINKNETPPQFKQIRIKEDIPVHQTPRLENQRQGKKKLDHKIYVKYNDVSITIQEDSDLENCLKIIRNLLTT